MKKDKQINRSLIIFPDQKIFIAYQKIKQSGFRTLAVINKQKKLLGTISDGDLRRSLLKGKNINSDINNIYNKKPKFYFQNKYNINNIKKQIIKHQFGIIPITDKQKKLVDIFTWDDVFKNKIKKRRKKLNIDVIIMAGGEGTRLKPYTHILPKPLVPLKERPIIDHIINSFYQNGFKKFYVTINFKSKIIKSYFQEAKQKYKINFHEEKSPLGTVGAVKSIKKLSKNFIITNCDTIFNIDLHHLIEFHRKYKFDLTMVVSQKNINFPYGSCEIDKNFNLIKMNEKPKFKLFANTGLYVLNQKISKLIPKNRYYDINHLILRAQKKNLKIGTFLINEKNWVDVGQISDLSKHLSF